MKGDSSGSDSDAEDAASKGVGATLVTASTSTTASKSELTNRLKNLYSSPPAPKAQVPPAGGAPPPTQVSRPTAAPAVAPLPRSRSSSGGGGGPGAVTSTTRIPAPLPSARTAVPPPNSSSSRGVVPAQQKRGVPPMVVHTNHLQPPTQPPVQSSGVQQAAVGRVPAPLPKARWVGINSVFDICLQMHLLMCYHYIRLHHTKKIQPLCPPKQQSCISPRPHIVQTPHRLRCPPSKPIKNKCQPACATRIIVVAAAAVSSSSSRTTADPPCGHAAAAR